MVVGDYLRKKLIEPLEERRRQEAEQRQREAMEKGMAAGRAAGRVEGRAEAEAEVNAAWKAWNERRLAAEANGEPFDEPPPGASANGDGK